MAPRSVSKAKPKPATKVSPSQPPEHTEVEAQLAQPSTSAPSISSSISSEDAKLLATITKQLPGYKHGQVLKAAKSLLKFIGHQQDASKSLFNEDDELLYLVVALKKMPVAKKKDKPIRLPLPHALYGSDNQSICLFVKDQQGEGHKAAKRLLAGLEKNGGVAKVVGVSKLRTKYESHEAKRKLCTSYDLFLADERILPSLPKLIGKSFFKKKKQPIPVDLAWGSWAAAVAAACRATYLHNQGGTCLSIRVARSSFTDEQVRQGMHASCRVLLSLHACLPTRVCMDRPAGIRIRCGWKAVSCSSADGG